MNAGKFLAIAQKIISKLIEYRSGNSKISLAAQIEITSRMKQGLGLGGRGMKVGKQA